MHYSRARQIFMSLLFYVVASAAVPLLAHGQNTPPQSTQQQQSDQKEKIEQQALRIEETQVTAEREQSADSPVEGYRATHSATATKTDTPLIETPQSISILTRDRLEAQDADTLGQALRYTAGATGESYGFDDRGYEFVQIRGFDATTFRDGLPVKNLNYSGFDFRTYAAERIEILRGPASVLYGQSTPGGLVNYVTKRPLTESLGELVMEVGSFNRFDGKFDLTGPLDNNKTLSYRLTGLGSIGDHQVNFIDDDRLFVAPALTWAPSADTTFTLLGYYQRDRLGGASNSFLPASGTVFSNPNGRIPPSRFTGEPSFDRIDRDQFSISYLLEHRLNHSWTLRQKVRYEEIDVDFEGLFGLGLDPGDPTQRMLTRGTFAAYSKARPFTLDTHAQTQFTTGPLSHTLLFGLDYQRVDFQERAGFGAAPAIDIFKPVYGASLTLPLPLYQDTDQEQQQIGLYLQDQIKLYDKLVLVLGGRYDWAETETDDQLFNTKTTQDDEEFTGRAGLVYLSDVGLAPYFSYSESFLPTLGTNVFSEPFKPETGRQYEVGVKYQPLETNSFVTLAAFDLRRQNVRATDTARAAEPQMAIVFVAFPGTNFAGPHHYAVFMRGTPPLTTRLFKPVLIDAQTAELTVTRELPWYVKALLVSQPLHFGDYGGMPLKTIWALLDILTIVVLGSGLYLWLKRRNVMVEEWLGTLPNEDQQDAPVIATVKQGEPV